MAIDAVVLAGGRVSGPYADALKTPVKALAVIGGVTVLERVVDALRETPGVRRVCVVGPPETRAPLEERAVWQEETGTALGNLLAGFNRLEAGAADPLLVCGSDTPALDAPSLRDFLDRAPADADICLPVVRKERFVATFPGNRSLYVPLVEGAFTSGSQLLLRPGPIREHQPLLERLFNERKSQFGMARTLGFGLLWRFLLRRLSVPQIEARASRLTGCRCRGVMDCHPELAYDLDSLFDLEYFLAWKRERKAADGGAP